MVYARRGGILLKGWRYGAFIGVIVGSIAITVYPIVIHPMLNVEKFKKIQEENRANIVQEDVQPGEMKVWSDPFGRKKN